MLRSVQGASVRVRSPLARLSSPWEKQRAEWGATLVRYQHSPIWQTLENQCVSMKCSIMSKRTATHDSWRPWESQRAAPRLSPPVATPAAPHGAAARSHCGGQSNASPPERPMARSSHATHAGISAPRHTANTHSQTLPRGRRHEAASPHADGAPTGSTRCRAAWSPDRARPYPRGPSAGGWQNRRL